MKDSIFIKNDELNLGVFRIKYSIYEKEIIGKTIIHKLYDVIVDDIFVGDLSVKPDLNNLFNTYKSSFCDRLKNNIEKKRKPLRINIRRIKWLL